MTTTTMTEADWTFVRKLARDKGVTLTAAGVRRGMRLGAAIDAVIDAAERKP